MSCLTLIFMIVATWMLEIPLWLQITLTVLLSLDILGDFKETVEEAKDEIQNRKLKLK